MTAKKKILIALSGVLSLGMVVHFLMIWTYVSPKSWNNKGILGLSKNYVLPLFYQDWNVFAPVPREKSRIYYAFYDNGSWSTEVNLEKSLAAEGLLAKRVAVKTAHYLGVETRKNSVIEYGEVNDYRVIRASYYYARTAHVCLQHLKLSQGIRPDSIKIILERELFPKPGFSTTRTIRDYFGAEAVK